jgi:Skp family chaperone for outer membrane proteins
MTRKLATFVLVTLLASIAVLAQTPAAAPAAAPAGPPPVKIGIVNIQQAIVATNEGQRDFQTLQKKFEPKRTELEANSKEVDTMKNQLNTQGDKLNEEARANLVKTIEAKQKVLQRSLEDAQSDYQAQQNDIANRIGQKMLEVLEKYATQNGYAVVLDVSSQQSPVLWASTSANITKPIVDAYNAQSNVAAPATPAAPVKPQASVAPHPAAPRATTGGTAAKPH